MKVTLNRARVKVRMMATVIIGLAAISGCSVNSEKLKVPSAKQEDFLLASDILHTFECELNEAYRIAQRIDERFSRQTVAVTLTLTLTEIRSAGGNATLVIPVASAGLSVASGVTPTTTNLRVMELQYSYDTRNLAPCEDNLRPQEGIERVPLQLEGGVGLTEWVTELANLSKTVQEDPKSSSYTIRFEINENATVAPTITISDDRAGMTGRNSRTVRHQLAVTVKDFEKGESKTQRERRAFEIQDGLLRRLEL